MFGGAEAVTLGALTQAIGLCGIRVPVVTLTPSAYADVAARLGPVVPPGDGEFRDLLGASLIREGALPDGVDWWFDPPIGAEGGCGRCQQRPVESQWAPYCMTCWFWLFDGPVARLDAEQAALEARWPLAPVEG